MSILSELYERLRILKSYNDPDYTPAQKRIDIRKLEKQIEREEREERDNALNSSVTAPARNRHNDYQASPTSSSVIAPARNRHHNYQASISPPTQRGRMDNTMPTQRVLVDGHLMYLHPDEIAVNRAQFAVQNKVVGYAVQNEVVGYAVVDRHYPLQTGSSRAGSSHTGSHAGVSRPRRNRYGNSSSSSDQDGANLPIPRYISAVAVGQRTGYQHKPNDDGNFQFRQRGDGVAWFEEKDHRGRKVRRHVGNIVYDQDGRAVGADFM